MQDHQDPAIRITLLPRDTNSQGTIFGGVILSYIDTAGAIEAHRHTRMQRFVTVAMKEVIFHKPVFVGDLVSFYAEVVRVDAPWGQPIDPQQLLDGKLFVQQPGDLLQRKAQLRIAEGDRQG